MATQRERAEGIQKGFGGSSNLEMGTLLPVGGLLLVIVLLFALLANRKSKK